jgi:hypothetical protein
MLGLFHCGVVGDGSVECLVTLTREHLRAMSWHELTHATDDDIRRALQVLIERGDMEACS